MRAVSGRSLNWLQNLQLKPNLSGLHELPRGGAGGAEENAILTLMALRMIGRRSRMKGHGLLAGMIIGLFVLTSLATATDVSIFDTEPDERVHKFGIQITGGGGMFAMEDINNYFLTPDDDVARGSYTEAQFGVGGGLAILYRSHDRFRWHVGYNFLGKDSFEGNFTDLGSGVTSINEHSATGTEFYVAGYYLYPFSDALHLYFGGGVSIVNATVDRISRISLGTETSIYDASGSAFGAQLGVGAELMITENMGIAGILGFRLANVRELTYVDVFGSKDELGEYPIEDYVWDAAGSGGRSRKVAADFTGAFGELGLRYYFDAATGWYTP